MHLIALATLFSDPLGLHCEAHDLSLWQTCLRGTVVFFAGLVLVRIADKRFFAKKSAFDVLLALVLGSTLGRAINGSERLFETIGVCFFLVPLHRLMAFIACRSPRFECLIKGHTNTLVRDGIILRDKLRAHHVSDEDLEEQLRLQGNVKGAEEIAVAMLERSGEVSVIKKA